ncbi:MAG TPA: NAD(P)H-binding protein, partial [Rubrivivax sp.]|nr:NAD(P)H-binding protein [Rubrivivax sp.]
MRRVLLLGGTGFVGRSLCERLVARGAEQRISVATRKLAHARDVQFLPTVDPVECDVHDDAQLARALAGHDAVVNLIGILHGSAADFDRA